MPLIFTIFFNVYLGIACLQQSFFCGEFFSFNQKHLKENILLNVLFSKTDLPKNGKHILKNHHV
jgi:hypothetical protein